MIIKARLWYSKVIQLKLGWDIDVAKDHADIANEVKTLLHEICYAKSRFVQNPYVYKSNKTLLVLVAKFPSSVYQTMNCAPLIWG